MIVFRSSDSPDVVNAMSVDVEDYFQVSAFDGAIPRDRWDSFESRVWANTERVLATLDGACTRATFFVLGWVAERYPGLTSRLRIAVTKSLARVLPSSRGRSTRRFPRDRDAHARHRSGPVSQSAWYRRQLLHHGTVLVGIDIR